MRLLAVTALVLLTACGAPQTAIGPSASPAPSLSPTSNPQRDLPAIDVVANARGEIQQAGGFVHFPGGAFTPDPGAEMIFDTKSHLWRTAAQPYLFGFSDSPRGRISYDPAVRRWLPVARAQVSSDGLHYAYAEGVFEAPASPGPGPLATGVRIHLVDVQSRSDRVVFRGNGPPFYTVVSDAPEGIYLSADCAEGCSPNDLKLWRLEPATGAVVKVSDRRGFGWLTSGKVAWVATYEPGNKSSLLRLDLRSGTEAIWLSDSALELIGIDAEGDPLVTLNRIADSVLLRVTAPGQAEQIFSAPSIGQFAAAVADSNGTWLGGGQSGSQGIYFYSRASGVRKVSDFPGLPLGPSR